MDIGSGTIHPRDARARFGRAPRFRGSRGGLGRVQSAKWRGHERGRRRFAAIRRPRAPPRASERARAGAAVVTIERVARDALVARAAGSPSGAGDDGVPAVSTPAAPVVLANVAPSAAAAASAATAPADDAPTRPSEPFVPTPDLLRFCEPPEANGGKRLKIAVLLSGGVDSSVALTLLKAAGHDCVAFYLQIWFQEDFRNYWDQCPVGGRPQGGAGRVRRPRRPAGDGPPHQPVLGPRRVTQHRRDLAGTNPEPGHAL